MNQLFEAFRCGDGEALVTFVYGEVPPAQREAIASHIARCATCAEEIEALGATRQQLAAWRPPEQTLGFRITRSEADAMQPPPDEVEPVSGPAVWWRQPLPAWAQMAAAVLIFASGMALGGTRPWHRAPGATLAGTGSAPALTPISTPAAPVAVTREELARVAQQLEQRLRSEIVSVRATPPIDASSAPIDSRAVMQRVNQMVAASEARQQRELDFRTSVLARDWANRRTLDLANIERRLGSTTARVINNQQDINSLAQRVALPGYSPYAP